MHVQRPTHDAAVPPPLSGHGSTAYRESRITRHDETVRDDRFHGEPAVEDGGPGSLPPFPGLRRHPLASAAWVVSLAAGAVSLFALLALLAAIPGLGLIALGLMLEAEGRVYRTGRLLDAVPCPAILPRLGGIVLGTWLWLTVIWLVTHVAADAALVDPDGKAAAGWRLARAILVPIVTVHLLLAINAGGSLVSFFRPLRNLRLFLGRLRRGEAWQRAADGASRILGAIAPGRLLWLGLAGFAGALGWLLLPTLLFSAMRDTRQPVAILVTLLGAGLLAVVLSWVPFLQARFAGLGRLSAFREFSAVREMHARAPVALLIATIVSYALSLPLYLVKVAVLPGDALLVLTPLFVATIYPARILVGWAAGHASRRARRAWWPVRLAAAAVLFAALAAYLGLLFLMPAIDAGGRRVLFDHPALLLPVPF
jgi:hypothetical protein